MWHVCRKIRVDMMNNTPMNIIYLVSVIHRLLNVLEDFCHCDMCVERYVLIWWTPHRWTRHIWWVSYIDSFVSSKSQLYPYDICVKRDVSVCEKRPMKESYLVRVLHRPFCILDLSTLSTWHMCQTRRVNMWKPPIKETYSVSVICRDSLIFSTFPLCMCDVCFNRERSVCATFVSIETCWYKERPMEETYKISITHIVKNTKEWGIRKCMCHPHYTSSITHTPFRITHF